MSMTATDQLVSDYLGRLRMATADLPPSEREELVANIAEHIATSMEELDRSDEAAVRTILDRLGDPAVIAAEARGQSSHPGTTPPGGRGPGWLEWGGVAMLGIGSYVLPVIGTVAGLIMVSMSAWWSTRQKVVAAMLSLAGVLVIPLIGIGILAARTSEIGPGPSTPVVSGEPAVPFPSPTPTPS